MAAAYEAASAGQQVTLFDRNDRPGRKLLVTGSGRCNISNDGVHAERYHGPSQAWMTDLLAGFGVADLMAVLRRIGVLTTRTSDGWYYPISDSAQTVAAAWSAALESTGVHLHLSTHVDRITPTSSGFKIKYTGPDGTTSSLFDRVILAAGGVAYPNLGSQGDFFQWLGEIGHSLRPNHPALAPVLVDLGDWKSLHGIRMDAGTALIQNGQVLARGAGNFIVTEWGLNGPAVMDVSHAVLADAGQILSINLLHFFEAEFHTYLREQSSTPLPIGVFLGAFLPPKLRTLYLQRLGLAESLPLNQLDPKKKSQLISALSDTRLPVRGVRGYEFCQVSAGGVDPAEVDPHTLESRIQPGLYLVGETLDVVGPCGGYNLHYAFASGALAGRAAGKVPS